MSNDSVHAPRPDNLVTLSDGARIATWSRSGPPGAPTVVLLHGGPGLWDYLEPVGDLLNRSATVHRYDQRGCGRSTPSDKLTLARYVRDLDELRCLWQVDRLLLVGHSFGGALALAYGSQYPEHTEAIVYLNGVGLGDWRTEYRAEKRRRSVPFAARLDELSSRDRSTMEEVEWRRLTWSTDYADTTQGLEQSRAMAETPLAINHEANRRLKVDEEELTRWAERVECPVWLIHGAADPRPVSAVEELGNTMARAQLRIIEGAGHFPWVERNEQTAQILREFVAAFSAPM